ncbi:unnamed protein product [Meganyctiphanes norvegica]|uniref:Uncharacterized protein n=1 Tax=Meganyctiphanes norvegica TaxID=48144 RepID=A0AAV2QS30_MEGNR
MSSVRNMQEILFAQRLADNDKKVRDRSLKKLRKYFAVKSSNGPGFTEDDMIKIWKGLFYCMYMSDKPLVQLVRKVLRYTFTHLLEQEWALEEVTAIAAILENIVLCPDDNLNRQPMGLKLHVCDIILEELAKIGGEALDNDVIVALLQPFLKVLAISTLETLTKKISNDIIRYLMKQSDLGIEAEEGEEEMEIEEDQQDENKELLAESLKDDNENQEDIGTLLPNGLTIASTGPLDPRAGGVDVCLPLLKPKWEALADALQALGSIEGVKQKNRDNLYKLVGELRDLAAGVYPFDVPEDNEDSDIEVPQEEMEQALDRLQKREERLHEKILKGKKWKKNQNKEKLNEDELDEVETEKSFVSESMKVEKKRKKRKNKKNFKPDAHTGVKKHKPNKEEVQLKEEVEARLKSIIPQVEMESTEFNDIAKVDIEKPKKKKNRKKKKYNGFDVTNISVEDKKDNDKDRNENVITSEETNTNEELGTELKQKKKKKKRNMDVSDMDGFVENKTKKVKKSKNYILNDRFKYEEKDNVNSSDFSVDSLSGTKGNKKNEKKESCIEATEIPKVSPTSEPNTKKTKKKKKKKKISTETQSTDISCSLIELIRKKKEEFKIGSDNNSEISNLAISNTFNETKPKKELVLNFASSKKDQQDPWSEPLKDGEIEVFIKSKKQIAKEKKKKKVLSSPVKKSSNGKRAIKINLKANQEHTVKQYERDVKKVPELTLPPAFPPSPGILKPSPSPILVRKKKSLKILNKIASSASPQLKKTKKKRMTASDFFY